MGIAFFGVWALCFDVVFMIVPLGIIVILLFTASVHLLRVPRPDQEIIETIIGKDPALDDGSDNELIKTIAHRGAGLDAPENSLVAFKMVLRNFLICSLREIFILYCYSAMRKG